MPLAECRFAHPLTLSGVPLCVVLLKVAGHDEPACIFWAESISLLGHPTLLRHTGGDPRKDVEWRHVRGEVTVGNIAHPLKLRSDCWGSP
jgi:hypothetical protein